MLSRGANYVFFENYNGVLPVLKKFRSLKMYYKIIEQDIYKNLHFLNLKKFNIILDFIKIKISIMF